jgi:hypothetical protein
VRDFEPEYGTVMRRIATFAGLCALEVLPAHISVFFHAFKSLERLPKLATSSIRDALPSHTLYGAARSIMRTSILAMWVCGRSPTAFRSGDE